MGQLKKSVTSGGVTFKWKEGMTVRCNKSHSVGYTEGSKYMVYKDENGYHCLTADDGLEDLCVMLVSTFIEEKTDDT